MRAAAFILAFVLPFNLASAATPAFPGAQGGGAVSIGGRGGTVCAVTNLNDSGPGSLRECAQGLGPRTVVFRTGGTIELTTSIKIIHPYITIAGQTAPGGGITLSGKKSTENVISITAHDVTIQFLRFRKGFNPATPNQSGDAFSFNGLASRAICDHCSFSWAQDENGDIWGASNKTVQPSNLTFSWSLFAEPLSGETGKNILIGADGGVAGGMNDIDIHHSLLANANTRNPKITSGTARIVNNLIYNYRWEALETGGGVKQDWIGNRFKLGPNSLIPPIKVFRVYPSGASTSPAGLPSIYLVGNTDQQGIDMAGEQWKLTSNSPGSGQGQSGDLPTQYQRDKPLPPLAFPINVDPAGNIEAKLLADAGASRRLDCAGNWVANRDAVDTRIINEYRTGKGRYPSNEAEVGGFPKLEPGTPCADSDGDGMPDVWETAHGLDPKNAQDGAKIGLDGFSNLEKYMAGNQTGDHPHELTAPIVRLINK